MLRPIIRAFEKRQHGIEDAERDLVERRDRGLPGVGGARAVWDRRDAGGRVWSTSLDGSYIAHIDWTTDTADVVEPPTPDQGARRVWSDRASRLWVAEWNAGQLSRYDPADGSWQSWRPPGDAPSVYAVYVDDCDIVWISDLAANTVLSFDPATETFTSYPGSAQGAAVRQILGRPGEVWLPESGLDRIMMIRTD